MGSKDRGCHYPWLDSFDINLGTETVQEFRRPPFAARGGWIHQSGYVILALNHETKHHFRNEISLTMVRKMIMICEE